MTEGEDREGVTVSVAVVERLALLRQALGTGLVASGFEVTEPEDLHTWLAEGPGRAVVMSVVDPGDYKCLRSLRASQPLAPVVVLMDEPDADRYRSALRAGASAVAGREGNMSQVVMALQAALAGMSLLPLNVARSLVATGGASDLDLLCPTEIGWLRALSRGETVHSLAESVGYSERQLLRLLHDLYQRMGVHNRVEAIAATARWGLLDS